MNITEILNSIPHRYPFVMIDRVVEIGEKNAVGIKNVTINEPYFQGHFPGNPVLPGVLIMESMAQLGGIFMYQKRPELRKKIAYYLGIDKARFRKPVIPGDQLVLEVTLLKERTAICQMHGEAKVAGESVAEADIMFGYADLMK